MKLGGSPPCRVAGTSGFPSLGRFCLSLSGGGGGGRCSTSQPGPDALLPRRFLRPGRETDAAARGGHPEQGAPKELPPRAAEPGGCRGLARRPSGAGRGSAREERAAAAAAAAALGARRHLGWVRPTGRGERGRRAEAVGEGRRGGAWAPRSPGPAGGEGRLPTTPRLPGSRWDGQKTLRAALCRGWRVGAGRGDPAEELQSGHLVFFLEFLSP